MEEYEGMHGYVHHKIWPHKKEFRLAMLEKKEKILEAKLDFIKKMKELAKKSVGEEDDEEEE